MPSASRTTPDFLLWAHQLRRDYKTLLERVDKIQFVSCSTGPKSSSTDENREAINDLSTKISALEKKIASQQDGTTTLASITASSEKVETRLKSLEYDCRSQQQGRSKVNDAVNEVKGLGATLSLLDREVGEQAREFKTLKDKIRAVEEGTRLSFGRLEEVENELNTRLAATDADVHILKKAKDESFRNLLATDRSLSDLANNVNVMKEGIARLMGDLKYHLDQFYQYCEHVESKVDGFRSMTTQSPPPFETQPNLERRWDEEADSFGAPTGTRATVYGSRPKRYPGRQNTQQRLFPAQASSETQISQTRVPLPDSLLQETFASGMDHDETQTFAPQLNEGREASCDSEASTIRDLNKITMQEPQTPAPRQPQMIQHKSSDMPSSPPGLMLRNDYPSSLHRPREEDIETQEPTPKPPRKPHRKSGVGLLKESQQLLAPSLYTGDNAGVLIMSEGRQTRKQVRPNSHFAQPTSAPTRLRKAVLGRSRGARVSK